MNINESPISWLLSPTSILEKFAKAHNFLKTAKCLASFTFFKQNDQIPGVKKNNPFFCFAYDPPNFRKPPRETKTRFLKKALPCYFAICSLVEKCVSNVLFPISSTELLYAFIQKMIP